MSRSIAPESFASIERALESPLRTRFLLGHVVEILSLVLARSTVPADSLVSRFYRDRKYLGSHDRGFIADILYDILRAALRHRRLLERFLIPEAFDRAAAIHIVAWLHEQGLRFEPSRLSSVLNLSPDDIDSIPGLLERGRSGIERLPESERRAIEHGLPQFIAAAILAWFPDDTAALEGFNRQAPITLRANSLLAGREVLRARLFDEGIRARNGRFSPDALLLERRLNAHGLRAFRDGFFEVQDEGSQMLSIALDPRPGWSVFDACAGSGGKTLHMAAIMKGKGAVHAHDTSDRRLAELRPRLKRSSAQNVRVVFHERYRQLRDRMIGTFNAVAIDAPCSGSGVLRRNPGARLSLEPATVGRLAAIQQSILNEYSRLVKPGGILLYATCSLLEAENEEQVGRFLDDNAGWRVKPVVGIDESMITPTGYYRSWPHLHDTDAFFGALLQRRS